MEEDGPEAYSQAHFNTVKSAKTLTTHLEKKKKEPGP